MKGQSKSLATKIGKLNDDAVVDKVINQYM